MYESGFFFNNPSLAISSFFPIKFCELQQTNLFNPLRENSFSIIRKNIDAFPICVRCLGIPHANNNHNPKIPKNTTENNSYNNGEDPSNLSSVVSLSVQCLVWTWLSRFTGKNIVVARCYRNLLLQCIPPVFFYFEFCICVLSLFSTVL